MFKQANPLKNKKKFHRKPQAAEGEAKIEWICEEKNLITF